MHSLQSEWYRSLSYCESNILQCRPQIGNGYSIIGRDRERDSGSLSLSQRINFVCVSKKIENKRRTVECFANRIPKS